MATIVVPGSTSQLLASRIAKAGQFKLAKAVRRIFPDGETYLRIASGLKDKDAVVVCSTTTPSSIVELLLLLDAAKGSKPRSLTCIIPYFGYSRQHKRYKEGEPVASRALALAISNFTDSMATVAIHDEQTLGYARKPFSNINVDKSMAERFSGKRIDLVMAPDDGAGAKAKEIGRLLGAESGCMAKKRIDANTVEILLPKNKFKGRNVLLIDDMISTGGTIIKAVKLLRKAGSAKVYVAAVHGVFAGGAGRKIRSLADELIVSDTIETDFSKISVAKEIAEFLRESK